MKKRFGFYFDQSERRNEFLTREKIVSSNHKLRFKRIVFSRAFSQSLQYRLKRTTEKHVFDSEWYNTSSSIEKRPVSSSRSGVATECCESSFTKSSSFPAAGPFSGAVFHGGQFNITINTVNKLPTSTDHSTQSTRSFKRINCKRVFESSDEDSPTQ